MVAAAIGTDGFDFVRLGSEANLPSWYSASQLLAVGALAAVGVWPRVSSGTGGARWALAPAAFFVLLSMDEGAQAHERLGNVVEGLTGVGAGVSMGPWLLAALPLYLALGWLVWRAARPLVVGRPRVLGLAVAGVLLLGLSAAGLEAIGSMLAGQPLAVRMVGVVEEVGEMMAGTTLLWAAWELIRAEGITLSVSPPQDARRAPSPMVRAREARARRARAPRRALSV